MSKEDFIELITDGISLAHFDFDEISLGAYIKAMVQAINLAQPTMNAYNIGTQVFYAQGAISLIVDQESVQFRMATTDIEDKGRAGRFCMEVIKFVGETSMDFLEEREDFSFYIEYQLEYQEDSEEDSQEKTKESKVTPTLSEDTDEDSDEWL